MYWPDGCLGYRVQQSGEAAIPHDTLSQVADVTFDAWRQAQCDAQGAAGFDAIWLGTTAATCAHFEPGGRNENVIVLVEASWPHADTALALTTVTYSTKTGEILDADIEINAADYTFTTTDQAVDYDLRSVLTHEAGHFLGLAHSADPHAAMYHRHKRGSVTKRVLSADDEAGICAAYPPTGSRAACEPGATVELSEAGATASQCTMSVRQYLDTLRQPWMLIAGLVLALAGARRTMGATSRRPCCSLPRRRRRR